VDLEVNQRAIRKFLNVRLIDLERVTGVAANRISESERGLTRLHPTEQRIITNFLRAKLAATLADEDNR
jgi:transcriptional regulator with XRE-family HTH domain